MSENSKKATKVTSIEEIREQAAPIVELPGWEPSQTIRVRLRRVTLLSLIEGGQLPNDLLGTAYKIATKEKKKDYNPIKDGEPEELQQFTRLLHALAKMALVEPTYEEITQAGGRLTDEQLTGIFLYCMQGLRALEPFRPGSTSAGASGADGQGMGTGTQ